MYLPQRPPRPVRAGSSTANPGRHRCSSHCSCPAAGPRAAAMALGPARGARNCRWLWPDTRLLPGRVPTPRVKPLRSAGPTACSGTGAAVNPHRPRALVSHSGLETRARDASPVSSWLLPFADGRALALSSRGAESERAPSLCGPPMTSPNPSHLPNASPPNAITGEQGFNIRI